MKINYSTKQEIIDNNAILSPMAEIFFNKYKQQHFIFFAPKNILDEIERSPEIKRILETKFWSREQRESKTENKNDHKVFDDGNNQNRIFYFEYKKKVYIYKTFTNHAKYINYLQNMQPDKERIIATSLPYSITKKN